MNFYFIDEGIDKVGGVERVINVLSNELCKNYNVTVISKTKNNNETFYPYNKKVKIIYMWDNRKLSVKVNKIKILYYLVRIIEKILYKIIIPYRTKKKYKINK